MYQKKRKQSSIALLLMQKAKIEANYDFITCQIRNNKLTCSGIFCPSEYCDPYKVKIVYVMGKAPSTYVISPEVEYHPDIHMYKEDNSLCLYFPKDLPWTPWTLISNTIIPWINEWIVLYELYLLTGQWHGPEAPHESNEK